MAQKEQKKYKQNFFHMIRKTLVYLTWEWFDYEDNVYVLSTI